MFSHIKEFFTRPSGYNIQRSVRLRSSATAYLNRTFGTPTNNKKWTISGWIKRGALGANETIFSANSSQSNYFDCRFNTSDQIYIQNRVGASNLLVANTTAVYRDPSTWYHIVFAFDSANATAANRNLLYVNNVNVSLSANSSLNDASSFNASGYEHDLGGSQTLPGLWALFDGYLTEINFVDGQALTPSSFGSTNAVTGVWQPAKYTGTYGTNGFYLNFSNNASTTTLGYDTSGNSNNWTTNNISLTAGTTYDSMTDVPTLTSATVANYAVLNTVSTAMTIADGNLKWTGAGSTARNVQASIAMTTGKWYWEFITVNNTGGGGNLGCGVSNNLAMTATVEPGSNSYGWELITSGGSSTIYKNNNASFTSYSTYAAGDVWGIALDVDAGKIWFSKNGTWVAGGNPASGTTPDYTGLTGPLIPYGYGYNTGDVGIINFGQRPFSYTPPTGFVALNTYNLSAGSITTSGTFTGNASTDGPFVYLNGVPTAMTINGNSVTFGTNADKLANGFKVRSSSSSYNASGSNTYSITTTGAKFKYANAQGNP